MAIIEMKGEGHKSKSYSQHPIRNQPKWKNWWSFMTVLSVLTGKMSFIFFFWMCMNDLDGGATISHLSFSSGSFMPQYLQSNSLNWCSYLSFKKQLREFHYRSKKFPFSDHFSDKKYRKIKAPGLIFFKGPFWGTDIQRGLSTDRGKFASQNRLG